MYNKLQLLDCTHRDGGDINDWNFGHSTIVNIFERQVSSNVDVIEIGFIDDRRKFDINRTIQPDTASFDRIFKNLNHGGSMLVAMIDYGTCSIDNISECGESCLDGIRVIFKKEKMQQAIDYCKQIKAKGYKVFVQAVSITSYSDNELERLVSLVNDCAPYAMSMVDTYGLLDSTMLLHIISVIDPILNDDIMLGFHAHNNFQLGFSNAVTVLNSGIARGILVDGSLYGMGKSAGNAPIELIAMYMNEHCGKHYNIDQVQEAIATGLLDIFIVEPWGYTLFYYIAASNGCHPNYVSYLINKRTLSITAVNEILQMIPKELKLEKDTDMLERLYLDYQDRMCNDKIPLEKLRNQFSNKGIVALGPGSSINSKASVIKDYINKTGSIVISVNYIPENIKPNYLFLTNSLRYRQMSSQLQGISEISIIATSNVTKTGGNFDYVLNYSGLMDRSSLVPDNSLLMMVKLLESLGVKSVSLAGFDGYSASEINYFQSGMEYEFAIKHAEELNAYVKKKFAEAKIDIKFVTESKYQ